MFAAGRRPGRTRGRRSSLPEGATKPAPPNYAAAVCFWGSSITHYSYSYAAQLVAIDEDGQIEKVTAAHDAGKIFNPMLFEGQVEGAVHMGIGYATSEDLPMKDGVPLSTNLRKMGILRAKEMPPVEVIGVEVPDPLGPYGAKGVGEIGLVPTAAAVANALYQFDGVRRTKFPMKLAKKKRKQRIIKL